MKKITSDQYRLAPPPLRLAGPDDVPFVSAILGQDASEAMGRLTTLISANGFFFLESITSSVLEAHMAFRPEGRGKEALHAARQMLRYAFDEMRALVVFGRIPAEDRPARLFTRLIGLTSCGVRDGVEWFEARADACLPR